MERRTSLYRVTVALLYPPSTYTAALALVGSSVRSTAHEARERGGKAEAETAVTTTEPATLTAAPLLEVEEVEGEADDDDELHCTPHTTLSNDSSDSNNDSRGRMERAGRMRNQSHRGRNNRWRHREGRKEAVEE